MPEFVSPGLADLINSMLQLDPDVRIPNSEILNHPWLAQDPYNLSSPSLPFNENEINPLIVDRVVTLGFPRKLVEKTMADKKVLNQITVAYYLILINFS